MIYNNQRHSFHIVTPSPWPIIASIGAFMITTGGVMYMHLYKHGGLLLSLGVLLILGVLVAWWRDVIREATYEGMHTKKVQTGLRIGMILFIISEVMFFFAFFWAFFHSAVNPTLYIGASFPPYWIKLLNQPDLIVAMYNTCLLVSSGATLTWAHHAIIKNNKFDAVVAFICTFIQAIAFTGLQIYEYFDNDFDISDSVFGSTFYMATGFHGVHVLIGTCFIAVCFVRFLKGHFTSTHHVGFEAAAWYWHFVDVVWLFLFFSVYGWGCYIGTESYIDSLWF